MKNLCNLAAVVTVTLASATAAAATDYAVTNSWGSSSGNYGGLWVMGTRDDQVPIAFDLTSDDGGRTLTGTMQYQGEGAIGFKGKYIGSNNYRVQNQWGGGTVHLGMMRGS